MNTAKKVVALLLCLQLTSIQTVFAQASVKPQTIAQQQIAKEISSADQYRTVGLVAVAGWATAACALTIMIKGGIKRAQRTHKEQLDIILRDLLSSAEAKSIPPYKISEVKRMMAESVPMLEKIEDRGYFYKYYQSLPTPDSELPEFWEAAYTKNGGRIPATLDQYRKVLADFQMDFNKKLTFSSSKRSKTMASLIIDINEKFYSFQSLDNPSFEESKQLLSSIDGNIKKLTEIAAKESPEIQNSVNVLTSQLNKEIELKHFRDVLENMEMQGQKAYAGQAAHHSDLIFKLTSEINNNVRKLSSAETEEARAKLSSYIERDSKQLAELAAKSEVKGVKEAASAFLSRLGKSLKSRGGIIGIGIVLVAGTTLMLISGSEQPSQISNKRLLAQRELSFSFENTPDMFLVSVINAKEKYGIEVVSSVIYEEQARYYPLFLSQINVMNNPKGKECLKLLVQGNNTSPSQHKATLLNHFN